MRTHRKLGASAGRLSVSGPYFVDASGALILRKSITGFCAPKRFATGRGDEALAYLDWVAARGFNEVRVFTQVDWTGPPGKGVEPGWTYDATACEQTILEAAQRGLRVELVAHTYAYDLDAMVAHLQDVDILCCAHENALLEATNEPRVNLIDVSAILARYRPSCPGWASGVYTPTPYPAGESVNYHSPRKDGWARCAKDAWEFHEGTGPTQPFSPPFRGPVMLDEPPQVEQTIRDQGTASAADDWRAFGAGCAFFGAGGTMHGNPGFQQCTIPTDPGIVACADAFLAGFADVPTQRYRDYDRGAPPTPSDPDASRRYFRWNETGTKYELCIRPYSFMALTSEVVG